MKNFLSLKYCSVVMLLILSLFLGAKEAEDPLEEKEVHPIYKGVTFKISGSVTKEYYDLLKDSSKMVGITRRLTRPDEIIDNLSAHFTEMVKSYNDNKSKLPSCLSKFLDTFLADLAGEKKSLDIWWLKQKYPIWEEMIGNEEGDGAAPSADTIKIWTAYANRFIYTPPPLCKICEERPVLTASLLFHELAHAVKLAYPECFKNLQVEYKGKIPKEELSADWAEEHIFGYKNSVTRYIDKSGIKKPICVPTKSFVNALKVVRMNPGAD